MHSYKKSTKFQCFALRSERIKAVVLAGSDHPIGLLLLVSIRCCQVSINHQDVHDLS